MDSVAGLCALARSASTSIVFFIVSSRGEGGAMIMPSQSLSNEERWLTAMGAPWRANCRRGGSEGALDRCLSSVGATYRGVFRESVRDPGNVNCRS